MSAYIGPGINPQIGLSEEQAQLIDIAAAFCRDKSPIDKVRSLLDDDVGYDAGVWQEIVELGWTGIGVPEEYGGIGLSMAEIVPLVEYMGRALMRTPYLANMVAIQAILKGGTEDQKQTLLPQLAGGKIAVLANCEDHADWNLENIACTASAKGDALVLSGTKYLVPHAAEADYVLASVTHDGAPALVIIEAAQLGADRLVREKIIDDTHRSYRLSLDGVEVSHNAVMDVALAGEALAHIELTGSLLLAADMCGGAYACIEYTLDYLKTRKQFGKLIGSYQSLKHTIVDAHQAYERARSHLYSAAFLFGQQGEGEMAVRMAKAEAGEAMSFAADRSIQFHGGFGFTYDCDAQLYRRRAIMGCALHGDARYHRRKLADLMF